MFGFRNLRSGFGSKVIVCAHCAEYRLEYHKKLELQILCLMMICDGPGCIKKFGYERYLLTTEAEYLQVRS